MPKWEFCGIGVARRQEISDNFYKSEDSHKKNQFPISFFFFNLKKIFVYYKDIVEWNIF